MAIIEIKLNFESKILRATEPRSATSLERDKFFSLVGKEAEQSVLGHSHRVAPTGKIILMVQLWKCISAKDCD